MNTIAIFGAGPGLGLAVARRYGHEGFRVALVARNATRLDRFVTELAADGVEAAAFPADLADIDAHADLLASINHRFGSIDTALINGFIDQALIRPTLDIDVDNMRTVLDATLLAPLSLIRHLLPPMLERGDGALLHGLGVSAKEPVPMVGSYGPAGASLRNYLLNLHGELAGRGVYVGLLTVGALIKGSDAELLFDASPDMRGLQPERVDPAELAEVCWGMRYQRDRAEEVIGALL